MKTALTIFIIWSSVAFTFGQEEKTISFSVEVRLELGFQKAIKHRLIDPISEFGGSLSAKATLHLGKRFKLGSGIEFTYIPILQTDHFILQKCFFSPHYERSWLIRDYAGYYLGIPLNIRFDLNLNPYRFYLIGSATYQFILNSQHVNEVHECDDSNIYFAPTTFGHMKSFLQFGIGAGFEMPFKTIGYFYIEPVCHFNFTRIIEYMPSQIGFPNATTNFRTGLTLGYRF